MYTLANGTRQYSHTSLSLWRLYHRRWYNRYIVGQREPHASVALFSVHLVHGPIAEYIAGQNATPDFDTLWKAFLEEVKKDGIVAHKLHTLGAAERIFQSTRRTADSLLLHESEKARFLTFGESSYISRADGKGRGGVGGRTYTADFKYSEAKWKTAKEPWPIKPLQPYDDQLLGQAIANDTEAFVRITLRRNPYTDALADPVIEERLVDAKLREEWLVETESTIEDIERQIKEGGPWEKNDASCHAYGRECPFIKECKHGLFK